MPGDMTELQVMQRASKAGSDAFPTKMETVGSGPIQFEMDVNAEPATLFAEGYRHCLSELLPFIDCVKALRSAQNEHARTLVYGHRCEAIRLGKKVDELIKTLAL